MSLANRWFRSFSRRSVTTVTIAVAGNFGPQTNLDAIPQGGLLMTGGLTLTQPLTLGQQLVYRSETVDPHPVVVLETSLVAGSSVPDSIASHRVFA
jgi:hypothetical protein